MPTHLIWDWNGTLLADQRLVLAATNEAFARLHLLDVADGDPVEIAPGLPALTQARYQELFTRPLQNFYCAVMQRNISAPEFSRWTELYHDAYMRRLPAAKLTRGARTALRAFRDFGGSQSLLSLWEHEGLLTEVKRRRIASHFVRIDGRCGATVAGNDTKLGPLRRHLSQLLECNSPAVSEAVATGKVAMIGDTIDDVQAARALGIPCILFTGMAEPWGAIADVPDATTLTQAVELARAAVSSSQEFDISDFDALAETDDSPM